MRCMATTAPTLRKSPEQAFGHYGGRMAVGIVCRNGGSVLPQAWKPAAVKMLVELRRFDK